jgi:hypothetical protein
MPMGNGLDLLAILGDQMGTKEKCHAARPLPGAPTVGVLTRQSDPTSDDVAWSSSQMLMQEVIQ